MTPRPGRLPARGGSVIVSVQLLSTGAATVTVRDTGVGISSDELPRIFDRLYRSAHSVREQVPGAGLGLSIARAIVEAHGGHIEAESEVGVGTTMRLTLPRA